MQDRDEVIEAQGGVLLAHTALIASVVAMFREKGVISQADVNQAFDNAMIGVEASPVITPATTEEARVYLERMAQEFAGKRTTPGT